MKSGLLRALVSGSGWLHYRAALPRSSGIHASFRLRRLRLRRSAGGRATAGASLLHWAAARTAHGVNRVFASPGRAYRRVGEPTTACICYGPGTGGEGCVVPGDDIQRISPALDGRCPIVREEDAPGKRSRTNDDVALIVAMAAVGSPGSFAPKGRHDSPSSQHDGLRGAC